MIGIPLLTWMHIQGHPLLVTMSHRNPERPRYISLPQLRLFLQIYQMPMDVWPVESTYSKLKVIIPKDNRDKRKVMKCKQIFKGTYNPCHVSSISGIIIIIIIINNIILFLFFFLTSASSNLSSSQVYKYFSFQMWHWFPRLLHTHRLLFDKFANILPSPRPRWYRSSTGLARMTT